MTLDDANYDRGILPQGPFTVTLDSPAAPASVALVSPDRAGAVDLPFTRTGEETIIQVDGLAYYDVLVIDW